MLGKGGEGDGSVEKNPSKGGVSAASVKGNAGPTVEADGGGKQTSQNQQYKKHNMQGD
ncbi:YuzL family protein [Geobacillus thermodenitrificans]|uniref:YuzL family protein n=1 Tax=Geobacillus thermodenitrificans TaxID=33940 RepID=UPI003D241CB0